MADPIQTARIVEAMARIIDPEIFADRARVEAEAPQYLATYSGQARIDAAYAKAQAALSTAYPMIREEMARIADAHVERGIAAILELQAAMDGHYKVIREYLDAERGPGFAHRVNSLLLRAHGQFFQIREKLNDPAIRATELAKGEE